MTAGVLGILGGGQLGRMLALSAAKLGLKVHIYAPESDSTAAQVSADFTCAKYDDIAALTQFANTVDVVTYEFENVPAQTASVLNAIRPVRPNPRALAICQDRWDEKSFLRDLRIAVAPFANLEHERDVAVAANATGFPAILKTRRMGYDGKGQRLVKTLTDLDKGWRDLHQAPMILEGFVRFVREVSVVAARSVDGKIAAYDPVENHHEDHILKTTTAPARMPQQMRAAAIAMTEKILTALDYVGVIGVEMFETVHGQLVVNELAPRVHNSGHWTMDACTVSQFEQHVRAVMGWSLGSPARHSNAVMTNLLGAEALGWSQRTLESNASLHLYGKGDALPGRKMGHLTQMSPKQD